MSYGSGVLQQRGACGMAGNVVERSEWRRGHASTGSVRNASEGSEWRGQARHMQTTSNQRTLFFAFLNDESTVLYGE